MVAVVDITPDPTWVVVTVMVWVSVVVPPTVQVVAVVGLMVRALTVVKVGAAAHLVGLVSILMNALHNGGWTQAIHVTHASGIRWWVVNLYTS